jgi:hypothetical protein
MENVLIKRRSLSNGSLTGFHEGKAQMDRALKDFDYHVDSLLADGRLSRRSAKFLERTWYASKPSPVLTLAQRPVRHALTQAAMLIMLQHCEATSEATAGSERLRLLSTCPDQGYCDYSRSAVQFSAAVHHVQRSMERRQLEGMALVDHALVDLRNCGDPTKIGIHFHGVCRPQPGSEHRTPAGKARKRSVKRNKYGLAVVQQDVLQQPLTTRDVALLGYYFSKLSGGLKEDHDEITRGSQTLWCSEHALRVLELYSHVSPWTALVAVGELGEHLKAECLTKFEGFLGWGDDIQQPISHFKLRWHWRGVYRDMGWDLRPLRID